MCSGFPARMSTCSSEIPRPSALWPYPYHCPRAMAGPVSTTAPRPQPRHTHMAPDEPAGAQNDRDWHGRCQMQPLSSLRSPPRGPSEPLPVASLLVAVLGCSEHGGKGGISLLPCASISWACPLTALVDLRQGFRDLPCPSFLPAGIMLVLY